MRIRLFTSQSNSADYIELNVLGDSPGDEIRSLTEVLTALYEYTDIDEIGIESQTDNWRE